MGCWLEPETFKGQQDLWAGHSPEGPLEREQNGQVLSPSQGQSQLSNVALTGGQQACSEEGQGANTSRSVGHSHTTQLGLYDNSTAYEWRDRVPIKLYLKDKPLACGPLCADSGPCHHLSAQPQIPWLSGLSQRLLSHPTCSPVWWVVVAPGHLKTSQLPLSLRTPQELLKAGNASGELEQWLPAAAGKVWALSLPVPPALPLLCPRTFHTQLYGPRPWTHSPEFLHIQHKHHRLPRLLVVHLL